MDSINFSRTSNFCFNTESTTPISCADSSNPEETGASSKKEYFIPPRRRDSFGNLSSTSYYPALDEDIFTPISDNHETLPSPKENLTPYLESIQSVFIPLKDDPLKFSVRLLQECQKKSNQTEAILRDLIILINELANSSFYEETPFYFTYESALNSLASIIKDKNASKTIALFESWVIYQLSTATKCIEHTLYIKEQCSKPLLKNSISYLLELFKGVLSKGPMKKSLKDAQKKLIECSLSYLTYAYKNEKKDPLLLCCLADSNLSTEEKIDILFRLIEDLSVGTDFIGSISKLPIFTFSDRLWIIQQNSTSQEDVQNRKIALLAFCNKKKHPIDRLKNLIVYLSYPISTSDNTWDLIEKQSYHLNQTACPLIKIVDQEIASKIFESYFESNQSIETASQSIRKNLQKENSLIPYIFSSMLNFSNTRIFTYADLITRVDGEAKERQIFECLKDGVKILRTLKELAKEFSHIPNTPPKLFKELNDFFFRACFRFEENVLKKSVIYIYNYENWPEKDFDDIFLTPLQMAIRIIGFFNQTVLDKLGSDLIQSEEKGSKAFELIKYLAPEVRFLFLKEAMLTTEYNDPALLWSAVKKDPSLYFLFTKNKTAAAIAQTKKILAEKVLEACKRK
jgi:hypothetical protein